MSEPYPLPSYAVSLWLNGDTLCIGLPAATEGSRPHTVAIPIGRLETSRDFAATSGWHFLMDILRTRASLRATPRIAERGAPTQYNVEHMLAHMKKYDTQGRERATTLDDLGLGDNT